MASAGTRVNDLETLLGEGGAIVLTDQASLDFYACDVFERGAEPVAVVRPSNKVELAAAMAAVARAGLVAVPRGAG